MSHLLLAPEGTTCGNGYCKATVYPDDTEIVRYMGQIYHKRCLNDQIVARGKQTAYKEFAQELDEVVVEKTHFKAVVQGRKNHATCAMV